VSPKNDWTQVRVWFQPAAEFGSRVYRTDGYVYQPRDPRTIRPAIHQVAVNRAAQMFPAERGQIVQPKQLETSRTEAAAAHVNAIAAEALAVANTVIPTVQAEMQAAPSAEGLVKVAKHVFRPNGTTGQTTSLDTLLFN
ncbi:MAG: hypothetical protein K2X44_02615, partial [Magnetospirillum sp.]|nr:hypothetical protein [Magnetospirillum sp.]